MIIAIASDHAGFKLKQTIIEHLRKAGHQVLDEGPMDEQRVDYPDFAERAARVVARGDAQRGVLVCGSGIGMCMSANKIPGIRAVVVHDAWEAEMSRRHNNANVACFGQRSMGEDVVTHALDVFLRAEFDGGRHEGRVAKIGHIDGSVKIEAPGE
ncbi:MAG: ribose 5-phosphate isomerase B [Planctomycetes bacterium]|nr:ribose 5-phosphate isomerase B [Planctomycetota bacterium]